LVVDFWFRVLLHGVFDELLYGFFLEDIDLQNLQQGMETAGKIEPLFHDRHEQVDADGDPYLCFDGIG